MNALSPREREVLIRVARGYTSKEIASQLAITPGSVDTYRVRVARKLELKSRAELVQYAIESACSAERRRYLTIDRTDLPDLFGGRRSFIPTPLFFTNQRKSEQQ